MVLCRLIYVSEAVAGLAYPDLKDIMEKSEKNNTPIGVSGMLSYRNNKFLQVLEGERQAVSGTYEKILKDERHYKSQLIEFTEIDYRLFTNWSMKVVQMGEQFPKKVKELSMKYSGYNEFDPRAMTSYQCLEFIKELATLVASA
ncbi:BLUF domain-containing protein [Euhalothece natronophila Z-M001]|uniref:BLUF domain-containing protein n=1 Tax=Euhalothece natronophila Z-M001 TaxID=522448 RepID=A0A5B8NRA5_9CHRO|nr:BLUF domain-containing protein [Euhalothece natronophila]QDZ41031.1 BLUF domain-containing protein [Euhalothece natronophila Z-M001]